MADAIDIARLPGPARNALFRLEKHGELIRTECGRYYRAQLSHAETDAKHLDQLARLGLCTIETVGGSTFAVAVKAT